MPAVVKWIGLEELEHDLANLPEDVTAAAAPVAKQHAEAAAEEIRAKYPARTGALREGVIVRQTVSQGTRVRWAVVNIARHAAVFEFGSMARHTDLGANRGSMPAGKVFVPAVLEERRAMARDIKDVMLTQGAVSVTGNV